MKKYGPGAPCNSQHATILTSREIGRHFFTHKLGNSTRIIILSLLASCGGDGGDESKTPTNPVDTTPPISSPTNPSIPVPIEAVPTVTQAIIELGPISGGTVTLQSQSGSNLGTIGTANDGKLIFDAVTKGWTTSYISPTVITRISADGISKLTYRTISSTPPINGYNITSVIETYKWVGTKFSPLSPWEIKFISPNIFTP